MYVGAVSVFFFFLSCMCMRDCVCVCLCKLKGRLGQPCWGFVVTPIDRSQDCGFKWATNHQTGHSDEAECWSRQEEYWINKIITAAVCLYWKAKNKSLKGVAVAEVAVGSGQFTLFVQKATQSAENGVPILLKCSHKSSIVGNVIETGLRFLLPFLSTWSQLT